MEKFKEMLKKRIRWALFYNSIFVIVISSGLVYKNIGGNERVHDFISGSLVGIILGIQIMIIYYIRKYQSILKDDKKLKKTYIYENDERRKLINIKIGGIGINVLIVSLAMGVVVAAFYNVTVYFTLIGVLIFSVLIKIILKIYLNKVM